MVPHRVLGPARALHMDLNTTRQRVLGTVRAMKRALRTARVLHRVQQHDLVEAVAEDGDRLIAAEAHEAGEQLQLLVRADADAQAADGVHLVLCGGNSSLLVFKNSTNSIICPEVHDRQLCVGY